MIDITAPAEPFEQAGEGVEGLLEAWLVDENDRVVAGQPVADAIVVKTSFQITAPCDGVIAEIVVTQGNTFGPGARLATVEPAGGDAAPAHDPSVVADSAAVGVSAAAATVSVPFTGIRGVIAREMSQAWTQPRVAIE